MTGDVARADRVVRPDPFRCRSRPVAVRRGRRRRGQGSVAFFLAVLTLAQASPAAQTAEASRAITLVSTTSTDNSGLLEVLLPAFTEDSGIDVRAIPVGTGQAMRIGRDGDADVLLVHHEPSEIEFVRAGFGDARVPVMYNDFVLIGPVDDPADVRGLGDVAKALARIASSGRPFVSRGDGSGTHHKELELWQDAGRHPTSDRRGWYRETGSGQGATLNVASAMSAYVLSDRATWLNFANKGDLEILAEGDERLYNPYAAILVNPRMHPHVNADAGRSFVDWLISARGQRVIAEYRIHGKQAFYPGAASSHPSERP